MVDEVSTLVTPSLHPENVKKIDGYSEETAAVLGPTEETLRLAYRSIEDVFKARAAADQNPTWNEAAAAIATQDYADKVFDKVARSFDSTRDRLVKGIASLEKELSAPVESKASLQVSQEVRAHFKTLPTEKRMSLLRKAIVEGDHTTATAVLGAPSYLSGFTPEMQAVMLRDYHTRHRPSCVATSTASATASLPLGGSTAARAGRRCWTLTTTRPAWSGGWAGSGA